jgi:hypothetical protein
LTVEKSEWTEKELRARGLVIKDSYTKANDLLSKLDAKAKIAQEDLHILSALASSGQ